MLIACSHYSLRYGTSSVQALAQAAAVAGHTVLALADRNTTAAEFDFVAACRQHGLRPILGLAFVQGEQWRFTALARTAAALQPLHQLLTEHLVQHTPLPDRAPEHWHDIEVIYPADTAPAELHPWEWIALPPSALPSLPLRPLRHRLDRCLAWQPVTFLDATGYRLHRMLRAVDHNLLLAKLAPQQHAPPDEALLPAAELEAAYRDYPQVWRNTQALIDRTAGIALDTSPRKNRQTYTGNPTDDRALLRKLAFDGCRQRYGRLPRLQPEATRRIEHELRVIHELGFSAYFLTTWDIVRYAKHRGFYHVGRGSGANSIVSYCMGITDVCPIELDLYFERFLNPSRTSPPDFDLDFSWDERDEVIDYIFKRYGRDHVALMGAYSTFGYSSTVREMGKVLGLPKLELDPLADDPAALAALPGPLGRALRKCVELLDEMPNVQSIHSGGMLIGEQPLTAYTACTLTPKGFPVTQMDMYIAEDAGYYKYDILSQRGLGHIKTALELVRENRGEQVDIHRIEDFKHDPRVRDHIRVGDTLGCFYIESPAMRQLLKKLRCDDYIRLVAASSIIRPGVAKSGMMQQYIRRFHDPAQVHYLHPKMEELLAETYGVMVYQEDVIKVATHFGGLTPAEGDLLRRAMSGKTRGVKAFEVLKEKFFARCAEKGYPPDITAEVWRQMESFGGYSFSKAHSASFAVESYQSLYLKTYYPLEFLVGVINNFGGFYRTEVYVHQARRLGATIHPPCLQHSRHLTHLYGTDLYLGFVHVKGLGAKWAEAIPAEREANGPFHDLDDLLRRLPIPDEQLVLLIRVGALRCFGDKKSLLWRAKQKLAHRPLPIPELFGYHRDEYELPPLETEPQEDLLDELDLLGFTTADPFQLLDLPPDAPYVRAGELPDRIGQTVEMLGWFVARKTVRTVRGELMHFGCWMDADAQLFDTVHFPSHAGVVTFRGSGFYRLQGKVVAEFGHCALEVTAMKRVTGKSVSS